MLPRYTLLQSLAEAQMRLQASQRRKKGTVKTQASHTPPTNSDASPVQPVDDSAWETMKAQARHSPATCTVFPTIHPAADSAWKNWKAESEPVRDTSDKVIIQDGRSDPAAHSFEEFRLADAGICLATRSEPDEATRETSLGRGLVILTVNIARVSLKKEVLLPKTCWLFAVVREGSMPRFPTTRCLPRTVRFGSSFSVSRSSVLLILQADVLVSFLSTRCSPSLSHLPATVKSLRVMRLKNLLCLLPLDVLKATIWSLFS